MKKIGLASVIITPDKQYFLVLEHKNGIIRVQNEARMIQNLSETTAKESQILAGVDAMDIIKEKFYETN